MRTKKIHLKMKNREHELQRACVDWFALAYSEHNGMLFAIPNGGYRHLSVARKLRAEGVVSGIPDLFLAIPRNGFPGMFIEMKVGRNKPTQMQTFRMKQLTRRGYKCVVCRSLEQFMDIIEKYMTKSK
jgi:hypothetical protein